MKLAMVICVTGLIMAPAAARADDEAAIKAAKAWLGPVLGGGDVTPAPTKDKPVEWVSNSDVKACVKLGKGGAGKVADGKDGKKLAACVLETWKKVTSMPPDSPENDQWKTGTPWRKVDDVSSAADDFPTEAQAKKVKAAAKGATIVESIFHGEMTSLTVYVAVGGDGAVRAVLFAVSNND